MKRVWRVLTLDGETADALELHAESLNVGVTGSTAKCMKQTPLDPTSALLLALRAINKC